MIDLSKSFRYPFTNYLLMCLRSLLHYLTNISHIPPKNFFSEKCHMIITFNCEYWYFPLVFQFLVVSCYSCGCFSTNYERNLKSFVNEITIIAFLNWLRSVHEEPISCSSRVNFGQSLWIIIAINLCCKMSLIYYYIHCSILNDF
jgi:hypothetical protein